MTISIPNMPVILCVGQSNMSRMVPVLREVFSSYNFISAAIGATSITQWQREYAPYDNLIFLSNQALSEGNNIVAMFFSQGEADTNDLARAQAWKINLVQFYRDFQEDTGLINLPMIYAQLGADYGRPYWDIVKSLQAEMQAHRTKHMVTLDHLTYADPPHYSDYRTAAILFMSTFKKAMGIL